MSGGIGEHSTRLNPCPLHRPSISCALPRASMVPRSSHAGLYACHGALWLMAAAFLAVLSAALWGPGSAPQTIRSHFVRPAPAPAPTLAHVARGARATAMPSSGRPGASGSQALGPRPSQGLQDPRVCGGSGTSGTAFSQVLHRCDVCAPPVTDRPRTCHNCKGLGDVIADERGGGELS